MDDLISLLTSTYTVDSIGQRIPTETATQVWAHIKSVSRSEWFRAGEDGLKPSFVMVTNKANYNGQRTVEYAGKRYSVYRTYVGDDADNIELYVEEKAGDRSDDS